MAWRPVAVYERHYLSEDSRIAICHRRDSSLTLDPRADFDLDRSEAVRRHNYDLIRTKHTQIANALMAAAIPESERAAVSAFLNTTGQNLFHPPNRNHLCRNHILRRLGTESSCRPPRHRAGVSSMAW